LDSDDVVGKDYETMQLYLLYYDKLKTINLAVKGVYYYTFNWINDKQGIKWADYRTQIGDMQPKFHVDLACCSKRPATIGFKRAPVK
jgi:hypothetical protein